MLSFACGTRDKLNRPARRASWGNVVVSKKYRANGILADDLFALMTRQAEPSMPISVSCGEIGTGFGVETVKQSLFHRNFGWAA